VSVEQEAFALQLAVEEQPSTMQMVASTFSAVLETISQREPPIVLSSLPTFTSAFVPYSLEAFHI